jgi:hypothetical protein
MLAQAVDPLGLETDEVTVHGDRDFRNTIVNAQAKADGAMALVHRLGDSRKHPAV